MKIARDKNGNQILKITKEDLHSRRGFSIQTNGNLPKTHSEGIGEHTIKEVFEYVDKYGTHLQRRLFLIHLSGN